MGRLPNGNFPPPNSKSGLTAIGPIAAVGTRDVEFPFLNSLSRWLPLGSLPRLKHLLLAHPDMQVCSDWTSCAKEARVSRD
jgi:hypothetical protein